MQSTRALSAFALALVLASGPSAASLDAQRVPSPYRFIETRQEAGAFGGIVGTGPGQFEFGPRSGSAMGVRYGWDVTGPFGLEGTVSYLPTTRDIIDPRRGEGDRKRGEVDATLLLADVRLRFSLTGRRTWNSLNPFVFAGAGVGLDLAGDSEADELIREEDRFDFGIALTGALGGGIRWMVSERFLVRGDAQLTLWQLDTPEGFLDPALGFEAPPRGEWANNTAFTLGLAYRF